MITNATRHAFGKIASRYAPSAAGLRAVVDDPQFRTLFPWARVLRDIDSDRLMVDFGTGPVDLLAPDDRGWLHPITEPTCSYCASPRTAGENCRNCGAGRP